MEKEVTCEKCKGEGKYMTAHLYPGGHTEVDHFCDECDGEGFILVSTLVEVPEINNKIVILL